MVAQKTPRTTTPAPVPAPAPEPAPAAKSARRSPAKVQPKALQSDPVVDPTTDAALLALSARQAAAPDIPIKVAVNEIASLARLAKGEKDRLAAVGVDAAQIEALRRFGLRLEALETAWGAARPGVKLTATQKKLRDEAETLDSKLVAGGRWGCRKDYHPPASPPAPAPASPHATKQITTLQPPHPRQPQLPHTPPSRSLHPLAGSLHLFGRSLHLRAVPARVCQQCNEPYFDAEVTRQILEQVEQASRSGAEVAVLLYRAA